MEQQPMHSNDAFTNDANNAQQQPNQFFEQRTNLSDLNYAVNNIAFQIQKVIVGQQELLELLIAGILCNGHILLEGLPGVAKTLTAKLLAKSINVPFSRIQFTPDLMPSDVIGTNIFNPQVGNFQFKKGPIFSSIVLIDEVNRSPAKTQTAMLEVMEERQITVDGHTYKMDKPFLVIATQNPVEQEGTYRLPEAQLDRFLFKINVPYPSIEDEIKIIAAHQLAKGSHFIENIDSVLNAEDITKAQEKIRGIHVEEKIIAFIANIVGATRNNKSLYLGASPRASIGLLNASKAIAGMRGRDFVTPDDVLRVVEPILCHRIIVTPEKEMEGVSPEMVVREIIKSIEIPR
jgi:MoxR-like ATPase